MREEANSSLLRRCVSTDTCKFGSAYRFLLLCCFCFALLIPTRGAEAGEVPRFDVAQSCRAGQSIGIVANAFSACMQREEKAFDQLKAQWAKFPKSDKARCVELCNCGGIAGSYVELLTCLQIAQESRALPKDNGLVPSPSPNDK